MSHQLTAEAEKNRMANTRFFMIWARLFSYLLLLVGVAIFAFVTIQPVTVLPRITLAPGYLLTNQNGERITSEALRGQIVLYNFTYSRCGEGCPQTSQVMAEVARRLQTVDSGDIPIHLITISVDSDYDTPEVLAAYARQLDAGQSGVAWDFLTGAENRVRWVVGGGFGVYYKQNDDHSIKLDPAFMLVDGSGLLRAEYRTAVPDVDVILRDINFLIEEAQNSDGPARFAYEAAHLFSCYPR